MLRNILMSTVLALGAITAADAQSNRLGLSDAPTAPRGWLDSSATHYIYDPARHDRPQTEQLLRWADVGRCVVGKDRQASLTYVFAKPHSAEATAAAKRVNTAFGSCFWGSQILGKGIEAYRRAALADALGVRLAS